MPICFGWRHPAVVRSRGDHLQAALGCFFPDAVGESFERNWRGYPRILRVQLSELSRTSIYEASERDFRVVLIEDAVSGLYEKGAEEMRKIGVAVMTTESFLSQS